jgi:hypothetical protein
MVRLYSDGERGNERGSDALGWVAWGVVLGTAVLGSSALQAEVLIGPMDLRADDLKTPMGIDDPAPGAADHV